MSRTAAGVPSDPATRLTEIARQRPEWQAWIGLLDLAWRTFDDAAGQVSWIEEPSSGSPGSSGDAPLLHGRTLRLDAAQLHILIGRLTSAAFEGDLQGGRSLRSYRPADHEGLELISAAISQDHDALTKLAAKRGVDARALATIAYLAALPALQLCGRKLAQRSPAHWRAGYCPICAAWPSLAERRGLDRSRRLRCGRCAADWEVEWLRCIYCGERDHRQLGSLAPDDTGDLLKVETCGTCRGYLKSVASLQGIQPFELLLQDLETIELDLVALQRGYHRPRSSGFSLQLSVVDHAARPGL